MKILLVSLMVAMLVLAGCFHDKKAEDKPKEEVKPPEQPAPAPTPAPPPVEIKEEPKVEKKEIDEDLFSDDLDRALADLDEINTLNLSQEIIE